MFGSPLDSATNIARRSTCWNAHTTEAIDFFAVELKLLRIDDSAPSPHLKLIAQQNARAKTTRESVTAQPTERGIRYQRFFEDVLADFKQRRPGATSVSRVGPWNWLGMSAGRSGSTLTWAFSSLSRLRVDLYIDTGVRAANKAHFDALYSRQAEFRDRLGDGLSWERLDAKWASRLAIDRDVPLTPRQRRGDGRALTKQAGQRGLDLLSGSALLAFLLFSAAPSVGRSSPGRPPTPSNAEASRKSIGAFHLHDPAAVHRRGGQAVGA